jgi:hypothetical protein
LLLHHENPFFTTRRRNCPNSAHARATLTAVADDLSQDPAVRRLLQDILLAKPPHPHHLPLDAPIASCYDPPAMAHRYYYFAFTSPARTPAEPTHA